MSAYIEYGVTDWLMAIVRPDLTVLSLEGTPPATTLGSERANPAHNSGSSLLAPGLRRAGPVPVVGSTDRRNPALVGQNAHDADLRGLAGLSFTLGDWRAFVDAQAAYRIRNSTAPDELHADLTLGMRAQPDLLVLLQAFNTTELAPGTPWFPRQQYTHVELSGIYDIDPIWSVQLGVFTTFSAARRCGSVVSPRRSGGVAEPPRDQSPDVTSARAARRTCSL